MGGDINLEVLLLNSLVINTTKIQTVVENFIRNKEYSSIFCLTETKVDSLDFEPQGIKMFSKHRNRKEKKGRRSIHRIQERPQNKTG